MSIGSRLARGRLSRLAIMGPMSEATPEAPARALPRRGRAWVALILALALLALGYTIVTGPNGTRTIQDGATLGQIERAIAAVE